MSILVCNAGSSSLKFSVFAEGSESRLLHGAADWSVSPPELRFTYAGRDARRELADTAPQTAFAEVVRELDTNAPHLREDKVRIVANRVVHGGSRLTEAQFATPEVKREILALAELAPLHNRESLAVIEAISTFLPNVPQIAVFDTAFHATIPESRHMYALPLGLSRELGLRRFGFHGLSHAYCAHRAQELLGRSDLRLVTAHLGSGASTAAIHFGRCLDTSMGFTPLEGLMMGTRSGTIDPGLLLYLIRNKGVSAEKLDHILSQESGLLGVSQLSSDMRKLLAAQATNPQARLAVEMYIQRICQSVGSMAASLNGIDALVFTAGVGERSAEIRARVCKQLTYLGLELDEAANEKCSPDADVAAKRSLTRILVLETREDLTMLREAERLLAAGTHR